MLDAGKRNVLGILINAVDYEVAVEFVIKAARERRGASISALAVHGLMTGVLDPEQKYRLNHLSLVVPDGQPVRWALHYLHGTRLPDRVYGPQLTCDVCESAERERLPVFFYGSTPRVLQALERQVRQRWPNLTIAGLEPSKFRRLSELEQQQVTARIRSSGARILFVGLGCPRQEVFSYEFQESVSMPVLAVGAAFAFLAGELDQAPRWMQDRGLEWLFRLWKEPRRLFWRYALLNPIYLFLLTVQGMGLHSFDPNGIAPSSELLYG